MVAIKSFGRDINGNSLVRFSILNNKNRNSSVILNGRPVNINKPHYSYSLQTMGNLPFTHDVKLSGIKASELTAIDRARIVNEITDYLLHYGSDKQKYLLSY